MQYFRDTAINGASRVITLKGVGGKNAPVVPKLQFKKNHLILAL
jgi:hypothetical protein